MQMQYMLIELRDLDIRPFNPYPYRYVHSMVLHGRLPQTLE